MKPMWTMFDHDDLIEWKLKIQDKWVDEFNREVYTKRNLQNYDWYSQAWDELINDFQSDVQIQFGDNEELNALYKKYYDPKEKSEIELEDDFFYEFVYKEVHVYMPTVDQVFDEDGKLREIHNQ